MTVSKKRFSLSFLPSIYDELDNVSRRHHLTKSQLMQEAFHKYVKSDSISLAPKQYQLLVSNLNSLQNQVARIGNNVNQFQHAINAQLHQGRFEQATYDQYFQVIQRSFNLLMQIGNRIADLRKEISRQCR